ncbi:signal peptidase I [Bacillus sp. PS06]|uniref:signal peptidase I n=1 Tax=Bacillus sp. PS06 TaxID=2764176 RepID=UPI00178342FF|nr:signal peptidase I [Bacillus sp. PS06]MBD8071116.1 signal peptidase I [Bacillus sp. PS06]
MQINGEIQLILNVLKKFGIIELPSYGTSMYPLIRLGDICTFEKCDPLFLQKGDIILFFTNSGQLIAHRFYRKEIINSKTYFIFKGDTNLGTDEPIVASQIIGKLLKIKRKSNEINLSSLSPFVWGKTLLLFPIISYWLRLYITRRKHANFI